MTQEAKSEKRYRELTRGKLYPLLVKMAVPSMIGMMVSTVYSMTDTYFVGRLNNVDATAAVGIVYTFISLVQAVGFWFGYGAGNYISRMLGRQETEKAEIMAAKGVMLALIAAAVILLPGLFLVSPLAALLGGSVSPGTLQETVKYLRITILTVPFMLVSNVLYNELRLAASSKSSMMGLLAGMAVNMVLDPVFILGLHMGIEGAAWASMAGQVTGVLLLWRSTQRNGNVPVRLAKGKPDRFHTLEILKGGAPNFSRQGISSLSSVLLNKAAGTFGAAAVAAVTVAVRIAYICYALVIGFGQGFQPVCAMNYGAGQNARVRKAFRLTLMTVTGFLLVSAGAVFLFADPLVTRFTTDPEAATIAGRLLKAMLTVMPVMGYYIIIGMLLQNIGRFGAATLVTISENGLFLIPAVLVMPGLLGLDGLVWCKPAASLLALLLSIIVGIRAWRKYLGTETEKRKEHE